MILNPNYIEPPGEDLDSMMHKDLRAGDAARAAKKAATIGDLDFDSMLHKYLQNLSAT